MSQLLEEIKQFQNVFKLKFVYRYSGRLFNGEKESTAAHTWGMFLVADYLLAKLEEICPGKYLWIS
ncbi:MAG: hypothetical protein PHE25_02320 [Candidatus Gracilibacteria bacterium]|nr:hypothetical protein [Candidatus Gracilibacteria bacterium]